MSCSRHAMARGSGWGSDVLGRKDTNDKASGLIILETVPSLQMRDIFSSTIHVGRTFPGAFRTSC